MVGYHSSLVGEAVPHMKGIKLYAAITKTTSAIIPVNIHPNPQSDIIATYQGHPEKETLPKYVLREMAINPHLKAIQAATELSIL